MRVDVYVNERFIAQERVEFRAVRGNRSRRTPPAPCLEHELLVRSGVDPAVLDKASIPTELADVRPPTKNCIVVTTLSPDASVLFDAAELRLDISIPQVLMTRIARGSVDPAQWDAGITAAFADYSFGMLSERTPDERSLHSTLQYSAGFNAGVWHWRYRGWVSASGLGRLRHRPVRWFLERPVPAWHMVLGIGEISGANPLLASVPLYGATLGNDERMLPDSRRGYAPPVRGMATGASKLTVSQRGGIVYQTNVPAGAFVIDDLNPVVNRGDLEVEIAAHSGAIQRFSIPSASTSAMVRAGETRFDLGIGCHRTSRCGDLLLDAATRYGLMDRLTAQAALQWTKAFASLAAGIAANTHAGALSFDAGLGLGLAPPRAYTATTQTGRREDVPERLLASRIRFAYATPLASLHATFNAETSLRLGEGSIDLREWFASRRAIERQDTPRVSAARRHASVPLELHFRGFFAQTLHRRFSWHASATLRLASRTCSGKPIPGGFDYQLGAGTTLGTVSLSLNFSHSRSWHSSDRPWHASLDLALRLGRSPQAPMFSTRTDLDSARRKSRSMALTGTLSSRLMKENRLDYSLSASCEGATAFGATDGTLARDPLSSLQCADSFTFDLAYAGTHGVANAAFSRGGGISFGTSGSVVLHHGGITFGPALGDTIALIDTKHGAGLGFAGMPQVRADRRGYAIVPYLTPYRLNDIEIDQANAPRGVRVTNSSRLVAPIAGAVVRVAIEAKRVDTRRFRISMSDGRAPPFGAAVRAANGERVSSMGQGGRLALPEHIHGALQVELVASRATCRIELDEIGDTLPPASAATSNSAVQDAPVHLRCR